MNAKQAAERLPPGPWEYCPWKFDSCVVRDAEGHIVARILAPMEKQEFYSGVTYGSDEWKAGPPKARAIAERLIRAEREADPTPIDEAFLREMGFEIDTDDDLIRATIDSNGKHAINVFRDGTASIGANGCWLDVWLPCETRGQLRRLMAAISIQPPAKEET